MSAGAFMVMAHGLFVTGTDTGVGKTLVASALVHRLREKGWQAVGMKPIAAGCEEGRWTDVEALAAAAGRLFPQALINPYPLDLPIAPHLAARMQGVAIRPEPILEAFQHLARQAQAVVVEGVGGFRVPLSSDWDSADLAVRLALPMILVVGMRLGCLNHALLTEEAIRRRGLHLAGWVANTLDPAMAAFQDNVAALQERLGAPCLGVVPALPRPHFQAAARYLRLPPPWEE
ncbi:dethiobiotin synthase [Pelomicrobium sp.]|jgi:dethiobiotin synthetase|uniref:dethiobiotin synthase n=1 Tax=Pelomicrobium sp. TaxID=2815319 RepID=UPI002FDE9E6D